MTRDASGSGALLPRFVSLCLGVLCANILWAVVLPTPPGRIVGAIGAAVAAALVIAVTGFPTVRARLLANPPAFLTHRATIICAIVLFLSPGLFLNGGPVLAYWRFDGRAALLVAWLVAITLAIALEHRRGMNMDRPTAICLLALFIMFSSGVWLSVVMDSGIASFMGGIDRRGPRGCQSDPFTTMITVWESNPPSEHLFLGWRSQESFEHRIGYPNHVHPYLLTMYAWIAAMRYMGGLTLWAATNTSIFLPLLVLVAAFATLLARSGLLWNRTDLTGLLTLFLAIGMLLTTWRVWIDLVRFNSDNPYPLLAGVLIIVYALLLPPMRTKAAAIAAAIFVVLSPVHTPMLILPLVCMFGQGGRNWREVLERNRSLATICAVTLVAGVTVYLEPRLLMWWKGYDPQASSFLFRSGLDGDTSFFSGIVQAAVAPCPVGCCYSRTLSELLFPAILPLAIFGPLAYRYAHTPSFSLGRQTAVSHDTVPGLPDSVPAIAVRASVPVRSPVRDSRRRDGADGHAESADRAASHRRRASRFSAPGGRHCHGESHRHGPGSRAGDCLLHDVAPARIPL